MKSRSLQTQLDAAGDPLSYLRSTKHDRRSNPIYYPPFIVPQVPFEFSSWEREQRSWRESVALFDQTHHMQGAFVKGPGAHKFLTRLGCNKLATSRPTRAHQMVACNEDGQLVGDGILFHLAENEFSVYGAPFLMNWIKFHAASEGHQVSVDMDRRSPVYANGHPNTRPDCRYQIQGPRAAQLIEKLNGGPLGDVEFFHMTELKIGGMRVRALRHGMAGAAGLEVWAPWETRDRLRELILESGCEFGIVEVGAAAYLTSAVESGWIAGFVPAIYTSEKLRAYREWLPDDECESLTRLMGSLDLKTIDQYYRTPFAVGYGHIVNFDHEFVGRDALMRLAREPRTQKVTLAWNSEDAGNLFRTAFTPDECEVKIPHLPYTSDKIDLQYDRLTRSSGGQDIGVAHYTAYTANERSMLTLALIDAEVPMGTEVTLHWGEVGGGFGEFLSKPIAPRTIRATVSPCPYTRVAKTG